MATKPCNTYLPPCEGELHGITQVGDGGAKCDAVLVTDLVAGFLAEGTVTEIIVSGKNTSKIFRKYGPQNLPSPHVALWCLG